MGGLILVLQLYKGHDTLRFVLSLILVSLLTCLAMIGLLNMYRQDQKCPEYELVTEHLYKIK